MNTKVFGDISIIIPTYNRPSYLKRILGYYAEHGIDFNIIVADSSPLKVRKANAETIALFPSMSIKHILYDPAHTFYEKIAHVLDYVDTEYCVICADDDFITPNGISHSAVFLKENQDYTVAHGNYICFSFKPNRELRQQFYWNVLGYAQESISSNDAKSRFYLHLSKYWPTLFAVQKKAVLNSAFKKTIGSKIVSYRLAELLPSSLVLISGKMKYLDVLYCARQMEITPANPMQRPSASTLTESKNYDIDYEKFKSCLAAQLIKHDEIDGIDEAKQIVDQVMASYLETKRVSLTTKLVKIISELDYPAWIDRRLRLLYKTLFCKEQKSILHRYGKDLEKIREHVIS